MEELRLRVFSVFPYVSPKRSELSQDQRRRNDALLALKNNELFCGARPADAIATIVKARGCSILGPGVTLIPVPRSTAGAPTPTSGPYRLAQALLDAGLASHLCPVVHRVSQVRSSSRGPADQRVTVDEHLDSLELVQRPPTPHVVLVDDVVTRGSTLIGCMRELLPAGIHPHGFTCSVTLFPDDDLTEYQIRELSWTTGRKAALNSPAGHW